MVYDLKIYKSWAVRNIKAAWVNTYQINLNGEDIEATDWVNKINSICTAEKNIHLNQVQFLHATLSSKRDEVVYDPKMLRTFDLQGNGLGPIAEDDTPLDLNIAMAVRKNVGYGRSGVNYYRGALCASDVIINERGESQIAPTSKFMGAPSWANINTLMMAYPDYELVMAGKMHDDPEVEGTFITRTVTSFSLKGVVLLKRDHRYFDRKDAPAPAPPPAEV